MESKDLKPIGTVNATDYDLYIKKLGCKIAIDQTKHTTAKPNLDGNENPNNVPPGYNYDPPYDSGNRKPGYPQIFNEPSDDEVYNVKSSLISIRPNPSFLPLPQKEPYAYPKPIDGYDDGRPEIGVAYKPNNAQSYDEQRPFDRPELPPRYSNQYDDRLAQEVPYSYPKPINSPDLGLYKPNNVDRFDYNSRYPPVPYLDDRTSFSGNYHYDGNYLRPLESNALPPIMPNKTNGYENLPPKDRNYTRPGDNVNPNSIEDSPGGGSYFYGKPIITHMKGTHGETITSIITEIKPGECKIFA